ncbi:DUF192 domain-containing protein [Synoicihabitans lomoniglobus]|nr:DUF192 domain-containing protein [Opitutaceae bacterium LMO-M01]
MKNANPVSRYGGKVALVVGCLFLVACGRPETDTTAEPKTVHHWFSIKVGDQPVEMQLALRRAEMEKGLMGRRDLKPGQGMFFAYRDPQVLSFWMRNTPTALDIGYFSGDGVLREIYPLHPFDERAVSSRREDLQYALEVPQGWLASAGITIGDRIDLEALKAAMRERGFDYRRYQGMEE